MARLPPFKGFRSLRDHPLWDDAQQQMFADWPSGFDDASFWGPDFGFDSLPEWAQQRRSAAGRGAAPSGGDPARPGSDTELNEDPIDPEQPRECGRQSPFSAEFGPSLWARRAANSPQPPGRPMTPDEDPMVTRSRSPAHGPLHSRLHDAGVPHKLHASFPSLRRADMWLPEDIGRGAAAKGARSNSPMEMDAGMGGGGGGGGGRAAERVVPIRVLGRRQASPPIARSPGTPSKRNVADESMETEKVDTAGEATSDRPVQLAQAAGTAGGSSRDESERESQWAADAAQLEEPQAHTALRSKIRPQSAGAEGAEEGCMATDAVQPEVEMRVEAAPPTPPPPQQPQEDLKQPVPITDVVTKQPEVPPPPPLPQAWVVPQHAAGAQGSSVTAGPKVLLSATEVPAGISAAKVASAVKAAAAAKATPAVKVVPVVRVSSPAPSVAAVAQAAPPPENRAPEQMVAKQGVPEYTRPEQKLPQPMPQQKMSEQKMPEQKMPQQKMPKQKMPEQKIPQQKMPEQKMPEQKIPQQKMPEQKMPEQKIPQQKMPEQKMPEQKIPQQKMPEQKMPEQKMPQQKMPQQKIPEQMPQQKMPQQKMPQQNIPEQMPQQNIPEQMPQQKMPQEKKMPQQKMPQQKIPEHQQKMPEQQMPPQNAAEKIVSEQQSTEEKAPEPKLPEHPGLRRIAEVEAAAQRLELEVAAFAGRRSDRSFLQLEELLTKELLRLDSVEPAGNEAVRRARKEGVCRVQRILDALERRATAIERGGDTGGGAGRDGRSEAEDCAARVHGGSSGDGGQSADNGEMEAAVVGDAAMDEPSGLVADSVGGSAAVTPEPMDVCTNAACGSAEHEAAACHGGAKRDESMLVSNKDSDTSGGDGVSSGEVESGAHAQEGEV